MKKVFLFALVFMVLSCGGQKKEGPYTIGVLQYTDNNLSTLKGFKDGLKELGFPEGSAVKFIFNGSVKDIDLLDEEARALIEADVDMIFASTTPASRIAAVEAKPYDIPVIFSPVNDPVASGILSNLRRPGGNVTGIRLSQSDKKRLEWMKKLRPELKNVMVPYNPEDRSPFATLKRVNDVAVFLNISITPYPVRSNEEVDALLLKIPESTGGIFLPRDGLVMSRHEDFAEAGIKHNLIVSTPRFDQVEAGVLTGYGFVGYEIGRQASRMAGTVINGVKPGEIPVETAEDYFFLNLKTAEKMNLNIPDYIVKQIYIPDHS